MKKELSEMTLSELWELFPIVLSEHKAYWVDWYAKEEKWIAECLHISGARISHIGSTAVNDIQAKPIIDILLEIPETVSMENVAGVLTEKGYICMCEAKRRKSFNKGYTNTGFAKKVFHLHLRFRGDNNELYFRDYLRDYPAAAKEYEALKLSLRDKYEHNRDAYTNAKTNFVETHTAKAKELYKNRYAAEQSTPVNI